jgi:malonyl-CoA O-methyltransferase
MNNSHHHHHQVKARFSAAARTYAGVSLLQDRVACRVMDLLPPSFVPRSVLDAGCGTGRLLRLARERWPAVPLTGLDVASGMIVESRKAFVGDTAVQLIEADMTTWSTVDPFDLVLSSSALHWMRPFDIGLNHVASLVRPGGLLAIGIMLDGTLGELRAARDAVAPDKTPEGRLPTFEALEHAARSVPGARIRRIEQVTAEYDLPDAAEVLRSVHEMGVTGGDVSRGSAPLTRKEINALIRRYEEQFPSPGGVRVTFEVGYLLLEC